MSQVASKDDRHKGAVTMGSLGMGELLIIFVIALIVFGPRKLPELGRSLGKTLGEFKRASNDLRNTLEEEIHVEDQTRRDPPPPARASAPPADDPHSLDDPNSLEAQSHGEERTPHESVRSADASASSAPDPSGADTHAEAQTRPETPPSTHESAPPADTLPHDTAGNV